MLDRPTEGNVVSPADQGRSKKVGDVPEVVRRRYLTDESGGPGLGFYVDATVNLAAFRDRGDRLSVARTDPNAIRDVIEIARHRDWKTIQVQGSAEFRREVWLAARLQGLEVQGYRPTQRDQQVLERRQEQQLRGEIQRQRNQAQDDHRSRARTLRETTRSHRLEQRGADSLSVVEAVVRARVKDPAGQGRIMDAARERIADWLERGARFEQTTARSRSPDRQRAR